MKKILIFAVLIFSLTFAQFSQAQAYSPQEGDKAVVIERTCGYCYFTGYDISIYRNKKLIHEEKAPTYGCKNPHTNGAHYWPSGGVSYYIFKNGSWQQVHDY